jgi:division protein CdvB (Snf7/Vps24/ESCRT-III family)
VRFKVRMVDEKGNVNVVETDVLDVEEMLNTLLDKLSKDYVIELSIDLRTGKGTGVIKKKSTS